MAMKRVGGAHAEPADDAAAACSRASTRRRCGYSARWHSKEMIDAQFHLASVAFRRAGVYRGTMPKP